MGKVLRRLIHKLIGIEIEVSSFWLVPFEGNYLKKISFPQKFMRNILNVRNSSIFQVTKFVLSLLNKYLSIINLVDISIQAIGNTEGNANMADSWHMVEVSEYWKSMRPLKLLSPNSPSPFPEDIVYPL